MCGLFGLTKYKNDELHRARKALLSLKHRGPDQKGEYVDENVYMGHVRLSILDTSELGKQPMMDSNCDVIISVNGEIYNFKSLKKSLEKKYQFKSGSDSEVILYGYKEWGIKKLVKKIDGMFAICIFDKKRGKLFLARDRYGIKPLYYSVSSGQTLWASELKAIQKFYGNKNSLKVDNTALYDFLTYSYVPTPKTLFAGISKLEPAHFIEVDVINNQFKKRKYWDLEINRCQDTVEEALKRIEELIKNSVREQSVSDVPIGFFLSGGVDSSTILTLSPNKKEHTKAFSISFPKTDHDESKYAQMVAKMLNVKHFIKPLNEGEVIKEFKYIRSLYDEPFGDTSCFPTLKVSEFAKDKCTVVLTGDGADEIFGGYNWYLKFKKIKKLPKFQSRLLRAVVSKLQYKNSIFAKVLRRIEQNFFLDDLELYTRLLGGMLKSEKISYKKKLKIDDDYDDYWYFRENYRPELPEITRLQYLDFHTYLHDDIFTKVDRASMSVGLECRVPFMNKELVEYLFSLPEDVRILDGNSKGILKKLMSKKLSKELMYRNKRGFSIPMKNWKAIGIKTKTMQEKILTECFNEYLQ